jgi:acylphosphatase
VGFRATARREAEKLKLKGLVRNLQDGSVEILAQGTKENLDALLKNLKSIFHNHIEKITVSFRTVSTPLVSFSLE